MTDERTEGRPPGPVEAYAAAPADDVAVRRSTAPAADRRRHLRARRSAWRTSSPVEASELAERLYAALAEARGIAGDPPLAQAFRLLSKHSGENKFRNAASVIGGCKLGRPTIYNDRKELARIRAFPPDSAREAVGKIAREMFRAGKGASVKANERRLRRGLAKEP